MLIVDHYFVADRSFAEPFLRIFVPRFALCLNTPPKPCYWMDEACAPGVENFLKGRGGLRCRILRGGVLEKGTFPLTSTD